MIIKCVQFSTFIKIVTCSVICIKQDEAQATHTSLARHINWSQCSMYHKIIQSENEAILHPYPPIPILPSLK